MIETSSTRNIIRFDYARARGWCVRFNLKHYKVTKFFSDSLHGSKAKALKAAKAFRDYHDRRKPELLKARPWSEGRIFRELRSWVTAQGERRYYEAWTVWIRMPTRPASTNYSIDKWGPRKAKSKAEAWLNQKRQERRRWQKA